MCSFIARIYISMCLTSVLISLLYFLPISVDSLRIFNSKCHEPQLNFYQFCYLKSHLLRPTTRLQGSMTWILVPWEIIQPIECFYIHKYIFPTLFLFILVSTNHPIRWVSVMLFHLFPRKLILLSLFRHQNFIETLRRQLRLINVNDLKNSAQIL